MTAAPIRRATMIATAGIVAMVFIPPVFKGKDNTPDYRDSVIHEVFDRLVEAIGEPDRDRPTLSITAEGNSLADHMPLDGQITIDLGFYDLCAGLGPDSLDALAWVIAHELAHYYRRHGVVGKQKKALKTDKSPWLMHDSLISYETDADLYGGFYSRMAGFNALDVAPLVLEKIYARYAIADDDLRYLRRDERKGLAWHIEEHLTKLLATYEAATYLTLIRDYDNAARCYEHLLLQFRSRELYNNAGAGSLLHALDLMTNEQAPYAYPVQLDADSRLQGVTVDGGTVNRSSRSPSPGDSAMIVALLASARRHFDTAVARDGNYVPALVNRASVELLSGQPDLAIATARKAIKIAGSRPASVSAKVMESIAMARNGELVEATQSLRRLSQQDANNRLVAANLAVLLRKTLPQLPDGSRFEGRETIRGIAAADTGALWPAETIDTIGANAPLYVSSKRRWSATVTQVRSDSGWRQFVVASPVYDGATEGAVRIGGTSGDVGRVYGNPPRIVNARQGSYWIYEFSKIIFFIDHDNRVRTWMLYARD